MASIVVAGDTSGSVTIAAPAVAGSNTLTLPAATGTVIYSNASDNLLFNSGYGSLAVAYGCRAWVNFNGTGTVAIRASGNVTSITDNGTGDYTVNITTAMPDANYSVATNAGDVGSTKFDRFVTPYSLATTSVSITVRDSGGALADNPFVSVAVFR